MLSLNCRRLGWLLSGVEAFDVGADGAEFFYDVFVAAIDVVNAVDDGFAVGDQASEDEARRWRASRRPCTVVPESGEGPRTTARRPSMEMFAPMRTISLAWR